MLVKHQLAGWVREAIRATQEAGDLPPFEIPDLSVQRSKNAEFGDYSVPVMPLSRFAKGVPPVKVAEHLARRFPSTELLSEVTVTAPGFLNFRLNPQWLASQVAPILNEGIHWARLDLGQGQRVQIEFVSINPNGPLHVGAARNAVLGDTIANVLQAAGYQVEREYYVNDAGTQMLRFGESLYARYAQALGLYDPVPADGYQGSYLIDMGQQVAQKYGREFLDMPRGEAVSHLTEIGKNIVLDDIRSVLEWLGIRYDNWFSERTLYEGDLFSQILDLLRSKGLIYEAEGATWFASTKLGEEKDKVLIRSTGEPGYITGDILYHYDKFFRRRFDRAIVVLGADHAGHALALKTIMKAIGLDPDRLTIILYQLVTLKRGGEVVRLSKRTGDIITLRELLEEVGPDAVRFMLLTRDANSQMDFDLQLAVQQSSENPVYYVQYAHARIASILRKAREEGYSMEGGNLSLLTHPAEQTLLRRMLDLKEVLELAALQLAPHHLTYYAMDLAAVFHAFYRDCRVVSSDPADAELTGARLQLVQAAKVVLAATLKLMGMSAPESM